MIGGYTGSMKQGSNPNIDSNSFSPPQHSGSLDCYDKLNIKFDKFNQLLYNIVTNLVV